MGILQRRAAARRAEERAESRHAEICAAVAAREQFDRDYRQPEEVAALLSLSTVTLRRWRCEDRGPRHVKLGDTKQAKCRYRRRDIEAFMADPAAYRPTDD
jgi:hypothetical protein